MNTINQMQEIAKTLDIDQLLDELTKIAMETARKETFSDEWKLCTYTMKVLKAEIKSRVM